MTALGWKTILIRAYARAEPCRLRRSLAVCWVDSPFDSLGQDPGLTKEVGHGRPLAPVEAVNYVPGRISTDESVAEPREANAEKFNLVALTAPKGCQSLHGTSRDITLSFSTTHRERRCWRLFDFSVIITEAKLLLLLNLFSCLSPLSLLVLEPGMG